MHVIMPYFYVIRCCITHFSCFFVCFFIVVALGTPACVQLLFNLFGFYESQSSFSLVTGEKIVLKATETAQLSCFSGKIVRTIVTKLQDEYSSHPEFQLTSGVMFFVKVNRYHTKRGNYDLWILQPLFIRDQS